MLRDKGVLGLVGTFKTQPSGFHERVRELSTETGP
jgi:hypothetical protein